MNKKCPVPRYFRRIAQKLDDEQLAVKYGVSKSTVDRWKRAVGITRRNWWTDEEEAEARRLHFEEGLTYAETARKIGRPVSTVKNHLGFGGGPIGDSWTIDEVAELCRLSESGATPEEAARALNRSINSINYKDGRLNTRMAYKPVEHGTLCWRCLNAVPNPATGAGCEWSRNFQPVPGWDADYRPVKLPDTRVCESYFVTKCPLFAEG